MSIKQQSCVEAMKQMANYIDTLGGDSKKYRQAIARAEGTLEAEKERCVGCEACIDTACGREECPKGWPKAEKQDEEVLGFNGWGFPIEKPEAEKEIPIAKLQWIYDHGWFLSLMSAAEKLPHGTFDLYTSPPQRQFVGLTDEEIDEIWRIHLHRDSRARAIEAKLKEKNT